MCTADLLRELNQNGSLAVLPLPSCAAEKKEKEMKYKPHATFTFTKISDEKPVIFSIWSKSPTTSSFVS